MPLLKKSLTSLALAASIFASVRGGALAASDEEAENFCKKNADQMLRPLNEANRKSFEKISDLRKKIDQLNADNTLLGQMTKLKDNYLQGVGAIHSGDQSKVKPTLVNGLAIKTIDRALSEESEKVGSVQSLPPENFLKMLDNFRASYQHSSDKKALKEDIKKVIESIPDQMKPQKHLSDSFFKCTEEATPETCAFLEKRLIDHFASLKTSDMEKATEASGQDLAKQKEAHAAKLAPLRSELAQILSAEDFKSTEKLKKYVAEKYLRTCKSKGKKVGIASDNLLFNSPESPCDLKPLLANQSFVRLTDDVSTILGSTTFSEKLNPSSSDRDGETFSPEEIKSFSENCNSEQRKKFKDVCASLARENFIIEAKKGPNWEKINEDYHLDYGRRPVKKASNALIIAQGVVPMIPMVLPAFIEGIIVNQQIDYLTNQAMAIEQMNHTANMYASSPWVTNPYYFFQQAYFSNPFTTSPNNVGVGGGFNFGP